MEKKIIVGLERLPVKEFILGALKVIFIGVDYDCNDLTDLLENTLSNVICSPICHIIGLMIFEKWVSKRGYLLNSYNTEIYYAASLIISMKMYEDMIYCTRTYYEDMCLGCHMRVLLKIEREILIAIDYRLKFNINDINSFIHRLSLDSKNSNKPICSN